MVLALFVVVVAILWIAYEVWRAPLIDDNYNIIVPAKKLKDLFKNK
jgi:hypothetical protein